MYINYNGNIIYFVFLINWLMFIWNLFFLLIIGYSILVVEMLNIENMDCVNIEFNGFFGFLYLYIVIVIVIILC